MRTGDISVIVRSCGRPQLLARAVASIGAQTLQPRETIVVAIGPEGANALEAVAPVPALRVLAVKSGRVRGAALNDGLRAAAGSWCAFLDDDDTWAPTFLEEMWAAVATAGSAAADPGAVVCRTELIYERLKDGVAVEAGRKPFNSSLVRVSSPELAAANLFTINAALWQRKVFTTVGAFREDLMLLEDWEFNFRASLQFKIDVLPRMLARYHQRPPTDAVPNTRRRENDRAARELQETWRKSGFVIPSAMGATSRGANWLGRLGQWGWRVGSRVRWWLR